MQSFISELASLIVTIAVLSMSTAFFLSGHATIGDITPIVSPVIIFWFYKGAFTWQPLSIFSQPSQEKQP